MASPLVIFPETTEVNPKGHLVIGGCDLVELAAEFGTPLYIFDETTLRRKCAQFLGEFTQRYSNTLVIYASKAFINRALARLFHEEGLGLDVVSGGELTIAHSVDFPMDKVYFHGNNKGTEELKQALYWGIGCIVVDNPQELATLDSLAQEAGVIQDIWLRLTPGIDPHTHAYITTGVTDSKFGFPLAAAEVALIQAQKAAHLNLVGLHFHLGSQILELEPYKKAIAVVLSWTKEMRKKHGFSLKEFSPGGGFALQYLRDVSVPATTDYAEAITSALVTQCQSLGLDLPQLIVEPGRAIIGQAGVALYQVGVLKDVPGVRKYVAVDGGMADNIRPALYGAQYEGIIANRVEGASRERFSLVGKFCESGDVLISDIELTSPAPGDIIAIPAVGAYCLAMGSNYNASLKPAIVLVRGGKARLIRSRETWEDLMRHDLL
ncbi:MAG: diaminopimelate decarboxylase [Chloroflexi bacterium]|nr:diaminopimelate decarboxylase [Chloroflexota bacterium]